MTTFRDPVRTGRLRLDGLSATERLLARVGLVTMVLLLISVLFADTWRRGRLVPLTNYDVPQFVPAGLVPVTLVAFFVAVALVVWGAFDAAPSVRVAVAVGYLVTVSALLTPATTDVGGSWLLAHGETVIHVGFWTPIAALLLSAARERLPAKVRDRTSWSTAALRGAVLIAVTAIAVAHLGMGTAYEEAGFGGSLQRLLQQGFLSINGLLLPLSFIAAVAITDFAADISTSVAEPVRRTPDRWLGRLRAGLLAVIGVRLFFLVVRDLDDWRNLVSREPGTLVNTLVFTALLAAICVYVSLTVPAEPGAAVDEAKERITSGAAFLLSLSVLVLMATLGLALLMVTYFLDDTLVRLADRLPVDRITELAPLSAGVVAVAFGLVGIRAGSPVRTRTDRRRRELCTGLLVVGAWSVAVWVYAVAGGHWGFSYPTIDLTVTLGVLAWLGLRWKQVGVSEICMLLAVLVFGWLVISRGDYLSFLGGLLGLPGIVVVVFGVLYTLLSGSGFTTESSRRLPRESRTLMFVGYLLMSVTILNWFEVLHTPSDGFIGDTAFYELALPVAAWLLIRRVIPRELAVTSASDA